ncbi:rhamnogalacturonan acetylesterase [Silvibacterium sp.]|uniref:rhamnogalacturonan acetylesterase n=1 Tax=Silvibacterium sp. TaxID=1964179 RepID=UPI0039E589B2
MISRSRSIILSRLLMMPALLLVLIAMHKTALAEDHNTTPRTLWVAGDSTANNQWNGGWGQSLPSLFDAQQVKVENHAKAGSSSRTFYHEQLWQHVLDGLHSGDWVLIAFGHNDGGPAGAPKYRGSLPGLGDETQTVELADHTQETVHTYGWYVRRMVDDAKSRGAHPVLVGVTVRNIWTDGHIERVMGDFNQWDRQIAAQEHIPFLDLTDLMADRLEKIGQQQLAPLFPNDHTHNNAQGGMLNAEGVVACLKGLHPWHAKKLYSASGRQVHAAPKALVVQ